MSILRFFTPEIALLFFAFLVVFFVSISFPARKTVVILMALYVWRTLSLAAADALSLAPNMDQKTGEYSLMAGSALLAWFMYWLFGKMAWERFEKMPWLFALFLNVSAVGLFASSLFLLFPVVMGTIFPGAGMKLFATPEMNLAWLFAPIVFLWFLYILPKKIVRTKLKIK